MTTEQWIAIWYVVDFWFYAAMGLCLIVAAVRGLRRIKRAISALSRLIDKHQN
jgi:hypothetical protein